RFLDQAKIAQQPLDRAGFLDRIQVGALQVLHQGQFEPLLEPAATAGVNDDRDLAETGDLRGAQPAFAGDQLEAIQALAHQQRLENAVHPDRVGQLLRGITVRNVFSGYWARTCWATCSARVVRGSNSVSTMPPILSRGFSSRWMSCVVWVSAPNPSSA